MVRQMEDCVIYSEKYHTHGHWEVQQQYHELVFAYAGEEVRLKTNAEFNSKTWPWLNRLAVLKMEDYIEQRQLDEAFEALMAGMEQKV